MIKLTLPSAGQEVLHHIYPLDAFLSRDFDSLAPARLLDLNLHHVMSILTLRQ